MFSSDKFLLSGVSVSLVWFMLAVSSIVFIEPALYDMLGLGLLVVFLAAGLRLPAGIGLPFCLLGLYLIANLVSAAINIPVESIRTLWIRTALVLNWLLFTCLIYYMPKRFYTAIWNGWVMAGCIAVLVGLGAYTHLLPVSDIALDYDRVRGTFKDPNVFGPFLIPPLLYLLVEIENKSPRVALFIFIISLLLLTGIFLSFSRGAWLATFISVITYGGIRYQLERSNHIRKQIFKVIFAVFVVALLTPLVGSLSKGASDTFSNRFTVKQQYDNQRFSSQLEAVSIVQTHPAGIGPSRSDDMLPAGVITHNVYLHVLLESGWLGAAAFMLFIFFSLNYGYLCCKKHSEIQKDSIIVFCSLLGLTLQSFFIDSTHWRHFYLLLGLMWGSILHSRYKSKKSLSSDKNV